MSVFIKGMKMPKDCNACFLDLYDRQTYCHNGEKALCPLVEVKTSHGRLIDADELCEHIVRDRLDSRELIMNMVDRALTIIEEEVE